MSFSPYFVAFGFVFPSPLAGGVAALRGRVRGKANTDDAKLF